MAEKATFKQSKRGKAIKGGVRKNILSVYTQLREINPHDSTNSLVEKVAQLTGVSKRTIFRLKKEEGNPEALKTPGKRRPNAVGKHTRLVKYDSFILSGIRRKVHGFFRRNELPTLDKITKEVNEDPEVCEKNINRSTLHRILQDLGFCYAKQKKKGVLLEKPDIVLGRRTYLRKIKEYKKKNKLIYYLDETWINDGQDATIKSGSEAESKGKGKKLLFTHIGSAEGFVPGALDLYIGKKNGEEMDCNHFEKWFESVLPKLKPHSVIVMDNASYHLAKVEEVPTATWKKDAIQEWLSKKNVSWTPDMIRVELLQKVSEIAGMFDKLRVEAMADKYGHVVLRLPPHHSELNAIEMIWSQVKERVVRKNKTLRLHDVTDLVIQTVKNVSVENWIDCTNHVTIEEDQMWETDGLVDELYDNHNFRISINRSSTESDSESMSADETFLQDNNSVKEKGGGTYSNMDIGPNLYQYPEQTQPKRGRKKNSSPPVYSPVPSKRQFYVGDTTKDGKVVLKATNKQNSEPRPETVLRPESSFLNLLMATMSSSDVVELNPSDHITPDVNPPDISAPGPSNRTEPDSSILEPLITIKEDPDPVNYK